MSTPETSEHRKPTICSAPWNPSSALRMQPHNRAKGCLIRAARGLKRKSFTASCQAILRGSHTVDKELLITGTTVIAHRPSICCGMWCFRVNAVPGRGLHGICDACDRQLVFVAACRDSVDGEFLRGYPTSSKPNRSGRFGISTVMHQKPLPLTHSASAV